MQIAPIKSCNDQIKKVQAQQQQIILKKGKNMNCLLQRFAIIASFVCFGSIAAVESCPDCKFTCVCNDGTKFPQSIPQKRYIEGFSTKCKTKPRNWAEFCHDCDQHQGLKTFENANCPD